MVFNTDDRSMKFEIKMQVTVGSEAIYLHFTKFCSDRVLLEFSHSHLSFISTNEKEVLGKL